MEEDDSSVKKVEGGFPPFVWVLGRPEARTPSGNQLARAPDSLLAVYSHQQDMVVSASARPGPVSQRVQRRLSPP